jgi:hypothetical protein
MVYFNGSGTDMTICSICCILKDGGCEQNNGQECKLSSLETVASLLGVSLFLCRSRWPWAGADESYLIESMHILLSGEQKGIQP